MMYVSAENALSLKKNIESSYEHANVDHSFRKHLLKHMINIVEV